LNIQINIFGVFVTFKDYHTWQSGLIEMVYNSLFIHRFQFQFIKWVILKPNIAKITAVKNTLVHMVNLFKPLQPLCKLHSKLYIKTDNLFSWVFTGGWSQYQEKVSDNKRGYQKPQIDSVRSLNCISSENLTVSP
jgi:hypothetical protein